MSDSLDRKGLNILIAGCGTGQHPLYLAHLNSTAHVTALDLSKRSLAYAKIKSEKLQARNINFVHGDILNIRKLEREFDIIESVGVLHHMSDPAEGLSLLVSQLHPDGVLKIGLYSRRGREEITTVRQLCIENGIEPSPSGIKHLREQLILSEFGKNTIQRSSDFYSMSGCRDMLFNVQEHLFSPLEIKRMLDQLELEFLGFCDIQPSALDNFERRYPANNAVLNLECWEEFETDYPDTFRKMLNFHCRPIA